MTTIVNANGEMLMQVHGSEEVIALNTPEGGILVSDPPHDGMYYDHTAQAWVPLPPAQSIHSFFDYETKEWKETRTLESAKVIRWEELKALRDELEFGGFEYIGNTYDSDQVSQGRILGAVNLGIDQVWTLADNSTLYLNSDELVDLYAALQEHISNVHERSRIAREKIESAQTIQEVEAVTL